MIVPRPPHRWRVTPKQAVVIQRRLARSVRDEPLRRPVRLVAGVDAAFSRDGRHCIAGVVLWDLETHSLCEQHVVRRPLTFPYVPGLLSFREAPAVIAALRRLRTPPDVLICDGHGFAHPRRFGIACHVGILTRVPTVGCAKSVLVGAPGVPATTRGATAALVDGAEPIGCVLRTQHGVKPVYVSVGQGIDLAAATQIVLACATRYRLPEPTRLADRLVAAAKRQRG